ncbi:DEKNAAC102989 [Brettanomyces naardenensis]|uniref:DEKNAAC102989 n=1 Tax=Brettanomyces naardenensis TaxID=13370 RepID=A0A448YM41_BRENA|nr:DEKNAAC102989 [Brettanomyces naardenensis]
MDSLYYLKQTVFPSFLVAFQFHDFSVRSVRGRPDDRYRNDPSAGKPSSSVPQRRLLTPFAWQELTEPTESMDMFLQEDDEDDEILRELSPTHEEHTPMAIEDKADKAADDDDNSMEYIDDADNDDFYFIDVFIGSTSLSIGGGQERHQFQFHSTVLSASVLPGNLQSRYEDTLIVSLESGMLLMIRFQLTSNGVVEPIITQRINLHNDGNENKILKLGYHVSCFRLGTLVAVSAFSKVIKLFKVEYDRIGIPSLTDSVNLLTGGVILKTCFFEPLGNDHVMMLNLVSTDDMLLHMEVNEFYMNNDLGSSVRKSAFSILSIKFEIPYFVIPLKVTKGILFVQETQCSVRGFSYFLSRDESDNLRIEYPGKQQTGFRPNSYYVPKSSITCLPCDEYNDPDIIMDQVVLSTCRPGLWLLDVFYNGKKSEWSMKIRKLSTQPVEFNHFSIEETADFEYELTYNNDKGVMDTKAIQLVPRRSGKEGYAMKVLNDDSRETNWYPVYDYMVVNSLESKLVGMASSQEFWCLGRSGKRGSLFCIRKGGRAVKDEPIAEFKNADKIYQFVASDTSYFVASFPCKSVVFCFDKDTTDNDEMSVEEDDERSIEDDILVLEDFCVAKGTIYFGSLQKDRFIQVFEDGWRIGTFSRSDTLKQFDAPFKIILAASDETHFAVAYESSTDSGNLIVDIECSMISDGGSLLPMKIDARCLDYQPSMLAFVGSTRDGLSLVVGDFQNNLHFYRQKDDGMTLKFAGSMNIDPLPVNGQPFTICHSVAAVGDSSLLITSKDGSYIILSRDTVSGAYSISLRVHIGDCPIDILHSGNKEFYLICRSLWKLDLKKSGYPERIWVSENLDRCCVSCVLLPTTNLEDGEEQSDRLLAIRDNGLDNIYVSNGCASSNLRKVNLGVSGLKLSYFEHQRLFIVIPVVDDPLAEDKLIFIDHKTRRILKNDERKRNIFKEQEYPVSVFEWKIPSRHLETYIHHHVVVGCIRKDTGEGSMKIIEIKKVRDAVTLNLLYSWDEKDPVYAINQLSNSTLVYGAGDQLLLKSYVPEESRMGNSVRAYAFLSEVKGIRVVPDSDEIIVTTAKDSFYKFRYVSQSVNGLQNDSVSRALSANSIYHSYKFSQEIEDAPLITIADKQHCTISTLRLRSYGNLFNSSSTEARAKVPYIPRIQSCDFRPVWRDPASNLETFVSVGLNGQIDLFTLIQRDQFNLLKSCLKKQLDSTTCKRFLRLRDLCPLEVTGDSNGQQPDDSCTINGDSLLDRLEEIGNLDVDRLLHSSLI